MDEQRTYVRRERVRRMDPAVAHGTVTEQRIETYEGSPSGVAMVRRGVVLLFGIGQVVLLLRIAFLLLDAREGNPIVSGVLDVSQILVAPFEGIFRTDALQRGGAVLDISAIAAFIGWTIVELLVLAAIDVFRRGER